MRCRNVRVTDAASESLEDDLTGTRLSEGYGDNLEVSVELFKPSDAVEGREGVGVRVRHACEG